LCSTSSARSHNPSPPPPHFAFPRDISSSLFQSSSSQKCLLAAVLLRGEKKKKNEVRAYTTSVSSCSVFLFPPVPHSISPATHPARGGRAGGLGRAAGLGLDRGNQLGSVAGEGKTGAAITRRGGGSLHAFLASVGWGSFFQAPEQRFPERTQPRSLSKLQEQH